MPLIRVINWPCRLNTIDWSRVGKIRTTDVLNEVLCHDSARRQVFSARIRLACLQAEVPGVDEQDRIIVSFDTGWVLADHKLIIVVEGLFDRPDRTKEIRDRFARALGETAKQLLPGDWNVEVFVQRFNPERDAFWAG